MNIIFYFEHNTIIRLIIVEQRVIIDFYLEFIIIRAKIYNGVLNILLYVGDKSVLCVSRLYFII